MRSTSGAYVALIGPNTFFPIGGYSRKQTCVSHSTPEAEIVAANAALRVEGLPAMDLWDKILNRKVLYNFYEDNQATVQILRTGKNPTLRHLGRTHNISVKWLCDTFKHLSKQLKLCYCDTSDMVADIFTKPFTDKDKWWHAVHNLGIYLPGEIAKLPPRKQPTGKDQREIGETKSAEKSVARQTGGSKKEAKATIAAAGSIQAAATKASFKAQSTQARRRGGA